LAAQQVPAKHRALVKQFVAATTSRAHAARLDYRPVVVDGRQSCS
jgi:hypothetical protein